MKKTLFALLTFLIGFTVAKAQSGNKISLGIGPELAFPFNTTSNTYGSARDYYQDGIGGSIKIEAPITTDLHFTFSAGFVDYPANGQYLYFLPVSNGAPSEGVQAPPFKFIPLKAGVQYYYSQYFYIGGEAGAAFAANSTSTTSFIYSGGLGAVIPFNIHCGLDLSVRYERGFLAPSYDSPMSQLAVRVAYKFKL